MDKRTPTQTLRVILVVFEVTFKQAATDTFVLFGIFVQPLIIALLALYVLGENSAEMAVFIVIGSGLSGLWTNLLFESGNSITEERWVGTLESLVGSPTPLSTIVFGKNLAYVTQSLGSMVIAYGLASLIFGYPLSISHPLLFLISIIIAVLSFVALGMVLATVFVLNPDIQRMQNGLEFPVFILGGFLFPVALLPQWTTPLSYILAPYWSAQALHLTSSGSTNLDELLLAWIMMIALGLGYLLLARLLFSKTLRKARADASLGRQ